MRKSTIWLLAVVMAFTFAGLLFLQVKYVSIILKKSSEQFNETVKRSMHQVSKNLELDETARYLEEDLRREDNNYLRNSQNIIVEVQLCRKNSTLINLFHGLQRSKQHPCKRYQKDDGQRHKQKYRDRLSAQLAPPDVFVRTRERSIILHRSSPTYPAF